SGNVTVSYVVPAETDGGVYTVQAVYTPGPDYLTSPVTPQTLTINRPAGFTGLTTTLFSTNGATSNLFTIHTVGFPHPTIQTVPTFTPSPPGPPAGVSLQDNGDGTALLSGTPAFPLGAYSFVVTASNGFTATEVFTLNVAEPPSFTSPATATFQAG